MADEDATTDTADAGEIDAPEQDDHQPEELTEVDQLAIELGWRPKSEWNGAEDDWTDSKSFLRKTKEISKTVSKKLRDVEKQLEGIGRATSKMTTQALERQRRDILAARSEAIAIGDEDAVNQADEALKTLAPDNADSADGMTVEGREWTEKHSAWFGKDAEATAYAIKRADKYAKDSLSPARQLAAVEADMKKHFPDLFPESKTEKLPANTPPSLARPQRTATPAPKEKGYGTLPPAARKACDDWVNNQKENGNSWASKDTWAASYYETQEATNG